MVKAEPSEDSSSWCVCDEVFPLQLVGTFLSLSELWELPGLIAFCCFFIWSEAQYCLFLYRSLLIQRSAVNLPCFENLYLYTALLTGTLPQKFHLSWPSVFQLLSFPRGNHRAQFGFLSLLWELETLLRQSVSWSSGRAHVFPLFLGTTHVLLIFQALNQFLLYFCQIFLCLRWKVPCYSIIAGSRCLK